jgi:hypothetical protein
MYVIEYSVRLAMDVWHVPHSLRLYIDMCHVHKV